MRIKNRSIELLEKIHLRIFGHRMGPEMVIFLKNLGWSFSSGLIFSSLMMIVVSLTGRLIGPEEYGKFTLLTIISKFITIFVLFGLDIFVIKTLAKTDDYKERQKIISSSISFVSFSLLIVILAMLASSKFISHHFGLTRQLIIIALFYASLSSIKNILDAFIKGLEKFKVLAKERIIEIFSVVFFFILLFFLFKTRNYLSYSIIIAFSLLIGGGFYVAYLKKYFSGFSFDTLKKGLGQSKFFMFSALLGAIFLSSDRIFIAKFMDVKTLGIYSAYFTASFGVITLISQLFTSVFLPASSKNKNKGFIKKMDRLFIIGFIPLIFIFSILIAITLLIFGKDYPLRFDYVFLFSLNSIFYFFQNMYNTVLLDLSMTKYREYFILSNIINLFVIIFYIMMAYSGSLSVSLILMGIIGDWIVTIFLQKFYIKSLSTGLEENLSCDKLN